MFITPWKREWPAAVTAQFLSTTFPQTRCMSWSTLYTTSGRVTQDIFLFFFVIKIDLLIIQATRDRHSPGGSAKKETGQKPSDEDTFELSWSHCKDSRFIKYRHLKWTGQDLTGHNSFSHKP